MSEVATAAKGSVAGTKGLEGVVAANSEICFIDGKEGRLLYQGYNIHELADKATFEEVCYLLWHGKLPTRTELDALDRQLRSERTAPAEVINFLRSAPKGAVPMTALRTAVSMLALYDRDAEDMSHEANLRKAVRLTAQTSTILCAFHRLRNALEKQISVNVDFYSATVQLCLGIPADLFTCIFAASRMAGWTAHIIEQQLHNRLIRPLADYIGPAERPYVPIEQRQA